MAFTLTLMQTSYPRVVFAIRQSPDWPSMAADYARGSEIAPDRYVPVHQVMSFPDNITACIARWNADYQVDFFACRAALRQIALATLQAVPGALILRYDEVPELLPSEDFRLFFLDDDDWFSPDTAATMALLGQEDVAVFPLLRLGIPVAQFTAPAPTRETVIGLAARMVYRYHTNNYALHPRLCTRETLEALRDHIAASDAAKALGLTSIYYPRLLSVTNKSPVSASIVTGTLTGGAGYRSFVEEYVSVLSGLSLPPHALWMQESVRQTAALFRRALGQD